MYRVRVYYPEKLTGPSAPENGWLVHMIHFLLGRFILFSGGQTCYEFQGEVIHLQDLCWGHSHRPKKGLQIGIHRNVGLKYPRI